MLPHFFATVMEENVREELSHCFRGLFNQDLRGLRDLEGLPSKIIIETANSRTFLVDPERKVRISYAHDVLDDEILADLRWFMDNDDLN